MLRQSERDDSSSSGGGDKFVFAGSAEPVALDPFFASDGETFRVSRQIFEGLVGTKPGTADPAPLLATAWDRQRRRAELHLHLRDDVKFQDGTDLRRRGGLLQLRPLVQHAGVVRRPTT